VWLSLRLFLLGLQIRELVVLYIVDNLVVAVEIVRVTRAAGALADNSLAFGSRTDDTSVLAEYDWIVPISIRPSG
jgi:hypothetical protein